MSEVTGGDGERSIALPFADKPANLNGELVGDVSVCEAVCASFEQSSCTTGEEQLMRDMILQTLWQPHINLALHAATQSVERARMSHHRRVAHGAAAAAHFRTRGH
jgi:hypothetical protein